MLWALVDQGCFSASNFGLTVAAARLLGPSGLGQVFVGFTVYLLALSLQRGLISDPLVVVTAPATSEERWQATRAASTATVVLGVALAVLTAAAGLVLPAALGHGLLLFAPWILPALLHDLFRTALFRDRRGGEGARNAVAAVIVMAAATWASWDTATGWLVVSSWGLGGLAAAALGLTCTRAWPAGPAEAWRWWWNAAWPLGRWLGAESLVINLRLQLNAMLLAGVLGTGGLGALRAAESLFAFMTLVGPALAMAGLPAIAHALERSRTGAFALAARIGGTAFAVVAVYVIGVGIVRHDAMALVFGHQFVAFAYLVIPIGVAQLLGGSVLGFSLFLKACSAGRTLMWYQVAFSVIALVLSVGLAVRFGVPGAAWGYAAATLMGTGLLTLLALRVRAVGIHTAAPANEPTTSR